MKYPQPTPEELAEPKTIWLSVNRFWWEILQGQIEGLPNPHLWGDYTPEIDLAIHEMMTGDFPAVANFTGAKAYRSSNLAVQDNTTTPVFIDSTIYAESVIISGGKLVITEAGIYTIKGSVGFNNAGGYRGVFLLRNSTFEAIANHTDGSDIINGYNLWVPFVWEGELAFLDEISIQVFQNSGGDLDVLGGATSTWIAIHRIG